MGALQAALGLDSGSTSQHLAALRKQGLVESRREGTSVYYPSRTERTLELLELAKGIIAVESRGEPGTARRAARPRTSARRAAAGEAGAELERAPK